MSQHALHVLHRHAIGQRRGCCRVPEHMRRHRHTQLVLYPCCDDSDDLFKTALADIAMRLAI